MPFESAGVLTGGVEELHLLRDDAQATVHAAKVEVAICAPRGRRRRGRRRRGRRRRRKRGGVRGLARGTAEQLTVHAAEGDLPLERVVEAQDEVNDRRLAASALPDERADGALGDGEGEVTEHDVLRAHLVPAGGRGEVGVGRRPVQGRVAGGGARAVGSAYQKVTA